MHTATLTVKGQLVIPKPIRDHLGLHPGDQLDFVVLDSGDVQIRPAKVDVRSLQGALARSGQAAVPVETMHEAVRRRAGAKARGRKG
ncbi:MAG: AbrB/MazE/SpoVT family DNA-binding domain-containing protein [Bryobacteraceae bacterium]